ncbi:hypothetical protein ACFX15_020924 [Malus domestica]
MFDEKLETAATKKTILSIELYDLQNHNHHTPLTPSFQCSDHEINVSTSLCHSTSYLPSLESDLTIKSSDEKSTRFPLENSETGGILLETSNTLSYICSYHLQEDYDNIGKLGEMHTLSRLCDGAIVGRIQSIFHDISKFANAKMNSHISHRSMHLPHPLEMLELLQHYPW